MSQDKEDKMLHINSLQLNVHHDENDLKKKIAKTIGCNIDEIKEYEIRKRSIDARKKPDISYSYSIDVSLLNEAKYLKKNKTLSIAKPVVMKMQKSLKYRKRVKGLWWSDLVLRVYLPHFYLQDPV